MNYTIRKTLAKNAVSEVLFADFSVRQCIGQVLVKTVLPDLNNRTLNRLKFAMDFTHEGIQEIVDFGECSNTIPRRWYLSTRYCPGVTLTQVLAKLDIVQKKAPMPFVIHVLSSVCNVLEYLHDILTDRKTKLTAVHGGLCLDNILITMNGDVLLVDTGIADIVKYRYTGSDLVDNTSSFFRHPELIESLPVRKYHEIYSTGLLLLCMLIGKNNFEGFCNGHEMYKLRSISTFFPSITRDLGKIIERATKFRGLGKFIRYDTIADFHYDLIGFAGKHSLTYNRELSSLLIHALFDRLDNEPDEYYLKQRNNALHYCLHGNDPALKILLRALLPHRSNSNIYHEMTPAENRSTHHNQSYGHSSTLQNFIPKQTNNTKNSIYKIVEKEPVIDAHIYLRSTDNPPPVSQLATPSHTSDDYLKPTPTHPLSPLAMEKKSSTNKKNNSDHFPLY